MNELNFQPILILRDIMRVLEIPLDEQDNIIVEYRELVTSRFSEKVLEFTAVNPDLRERILKILESENSYSGLVERVVSALSIKQEEVRKSFPKYFADILYITFKDIVEIITVGVNGEKKLAVEQILTNDPFCKLLDVKDKSQVL